MSPYFTEYNANPFGRHLNDCAARAVSAGLGMRYRDTCRFLGAGFKDGWGCDARNGIGLGTIQRRFGPFFSEIENAVGPKRLDDGTLGYTLDEFCEARAETGCYLVGLLEERKGSAPGGHIVYVSCGKGHDPRFYDTADCGSFKVLSFIKIRARWPKTRPESVYYGKA